MRFFTIALMLLSISAFAQEIPISTNRASIYLTWGYHRDSYTTSNIHFKDSRTDNYDFKLYKAKAKDQVDVSDFLHTPLTVPQYVLNIGYILKDRRGWGVEFSWDHLKYVVYDGQTLHLKGMIRGQYFDQDTVVTHDFVHFEHTNGNNYAMLSAVKQMNLLKSNRRNHSINALFKLGAGALVPKTDSYIMGNHNDGPFRFSGYVVGASANIRYITLKYFFVEAGLKAAFANYTHAKLYDKGFAKHSFFSLQSVGSVGLSVPL